MPYSRLSRTKPLLFLPSVPQLCSLGWVNSVPDPLLLRKSGSDRNRTRDQWICSQILWPLYYRGGYLQLLIEPSNGIGPVRVWYCFRLSTGQAPHCSCDLSIVWCQYSPWATCIEAYSTCHPSSFTRTLLQSPQDIRVCMTSTGITQEQECQMDYFECRDFRASRCIFHDHCCEVSWVRLTTRYVSSWQKPLLHLTVPVRCNLEK
jgi:hypothetical protein